jgi:hypothetical protein
MAINEQSIGNNLLHTINKLRIVQLNREDSGFSVSDVMGGLNSLLKMFEVQINPNAYKRDYKINYTDPRPHGKREGKLNFDHIRGEVLTLNFTLDGTGVIPSSVTDVTSFGIDTAFSALNSATGKAGVGVNDVTYVTRRIEELKKIVYGFNNENHEPPTVMVIWGDVHPFKGRMDDLQVNYTLFHPSGAPLRAEVTLQLSEHNIDGGLVGAIAGAVGAAASIGASIGGAALSSPDLTHRRTVKATDTLPLLCEDVYRDATFYWQVAQANNLTHFRTLEVGKELFFPPIER